MRETPSVFPFQRYENFGKTVGLATCGDVKIRTWGAHVVYRQGMTYG